MARLVVPKTVPWRKPHRLFQSSCYAAQHQSGSIGSLGLVVCFWSRMTGAFPKEAGFATRRTLGRRLSRLVRIFLCSRQTNPLTAKPKEMRMGKGKGAIQKQVFPVSVGLVFATLHWCQRLSHVRVVTSSTKVVKRFGRLGC